AEGAMLLTVSVLLVLFDCLMTLCGSAANDAAFSAWIADVTVPENRGRVNGVTSTLPVLAVVVVFLLLGPLYSAENETNLTFFLVLGLIPLLSGTLALLLLRDAEGLTPAKGERGLSDILYGFSPRVVRENKMMYVTLLASCLVGISQQTFFSYLINFVVRTLGYGDGFVIPMAVIIVGAAAVCGGTGLLSDRLGRRRFYFPLLAAAMLGTLSMYLLQFIGGAAIVLYLGGILMMGGVLALTGILNAAFQDRIPAGCEGRFQGVRMSFTVLLPMIVGPIISLLIGLDAMGMNGADFVPTYTIFLAATVVGVTAAVPLFLVRRSEGK
ncbi:MAG: MFS transporter, partial [Clostridia bacterium]|nr:MFS transporter [Clostridia bacterium]